MDATRNELIAFLEEARKETVALAKSLSAQDLKVPVHLEGWDVKDVVAHMASSEGGLINTANRIAAGQGQPSPGFDLHIHNQKQVEKRRAQSVEELLAEMERSRAEMLPALASMSDEQLAAKGSMSSGLPTDVLAVFRRIGDHERAHCQEIRAAVGR